MGDLLRLLQQLLERQPARPPAGPQTNPDGTLAMHPTLTGELPKEGPLPLGMRLGTPGGADVGPTPPAPGSGPLPMYPTIAGALPKEGPLPLQMRLGTPGAPMAPGGLPTPGPAPVAPPPGPFAAKTPDALPQALEVGPATPAIKPPTKPKSAVGPGDPELAKDLAELASGRRPKGYSPADERAAKDIVTPGRAVTAADVAKFREHLQKGRYDAPYSQGKVLELPVAKKTPQVLEIPAVRTARR